MARKYTRDNRGRFASSGSGATARGGRLKTASGNKRATQTMRAAGGTGSGVMKGAVKRDPGAMAKVGKAAPKAVATAKGNRQSRLASLSTKATAAVGQRRREFSAAADTAQVKRLDAFGIKGKKKMEAALN